MGVQRIVRRFDAMPWWTLKDLCHVPMPAGAKVVSVKLVNDFFTAWAEVDPEAPPASHVFQLVRGDTRIDGMPVNARYAGTLVPETAAPGAATPSHSVELAFHVYDLGEIP